MLGVRLFIDARNRLLTHINCLIHALNKLYGKARSMMCQSYLIELKKKASLINERITPKLLESILGDWESSS